METSEAKEYRNKLYTELAKIGKCLSSARRLELLELLIQCEKTVEKLATETQMTIANTSRHLQVLFKAGLVKRRKQGNFVVYSLVSPQVAELASSLKQVGVVRLEKMQADLAKKTGSLTITLKQAKQQDHALFLDVRPADEYQAGHIEGALNIPFEQLEEHLSFLPQDRGIIVYCRGKLCTYADLATGLLHAKGYEAYSLNYSYYDWITEKK
ncbi:metalloregulator ArsR/SmtB family transcription factor [Ligilactobacillus murinus]|uniref:Metalloregulator ArsR/SmtB family transcription factor n=1 Tax=Ligilactobacillus murinus TaxID=1622 RepID=A0A4S2ECE8_9LACO|nr:metalloregulator ArsR/SmtB family transcription factor [Ligilactobacillus murinus]GFI63392.1 putative HTH-type transcriptional regulator [Lactobacillaceae bacterium]MBX9011736.1 metalloregulator ArsR/SmtB family transcription factor [Ligilactobacillus murinus]MDO4458439.1 metalloregulator ArsR/SmtB family transcription factor [Ligilactobacillus murinus]NEF82400.1 metalloregulator ArsR/SmtB family transcription factor [Ligilactobacillus murinus]NEF84580.1 metalloregulator ArsR/SmtB family tr